MPWAELVALMAVCAPVARTGRPPFDLEMMLRIHCLQQMFGLSDLAAEEALFEIAVYCDFCGLSGTCRIRDRVSILRFRHLLEEHGLNPRILQIINDKLSIQGLMLKTGTVVDATLSAAPTSTKNKNKSGERDPEIHQTKKGNQWHVGMKAHIRVDAESGLVHTVVGTAANVNDVTRGHSPLHGEEDVVSADAGYQGATQRAEATGVDWHEALRAGKRRQQKHTPWGQLIERAEKLKASIRAKDGASVSGDQAPIRLHQGALSGNEEEHGAVDHAVCAVQHLDDQTGACAKGAGMSASANSQRAVNGIKNTATQPLDETIGADVSPGATCASMPLFRTKF